MGGLLIMGSVVLSVLLWADLTNPYILMTLMTSIWLAILGFVDDYVKLKQTTGIHRGLKKKTKLIWQFILASIIGLFIFYDPNTTTNLSFPFLKNFTISLGLLYIPFVALVIIGTTNAVNFTDGLDGLAIGCVLIVSFTLAILCYVTGHLNFSQYLFIPYVPGAGELTVFCAALMGASLGFLWFNCFPATVFMGDVGSLSLGGTLAIIAIFIKKELLFALIGGVFVIEALSVILQILSFKIRRKRIFKVSPLHHHFQLCGIKESKIIMRFWIVAIIFALLALTTLKIR